MNPLHHYHSPHHFRPITSGYIKHARTYGFDRLPLEAALEEACRATTFSASPTISRFAREVSGIVKHIRAPFFDVQVGAEILQVKSSMCFIQGLVEVGTLVNVRGYLGRSNKGALTLFAMQAGVRVVPYGINDPDVPENPRDHETRFGVLGTPEGRQVRK